MKVEKVPIDLDKRRHLVYDLDAVYELEQVYGSFAKAIKSVRLDAFDDTAKVLYFGLRHEDDTLSVAAADHLIDVTNRFEVIEKIIKAVSLSLPDSSAVQTTNQQTQQPDSLDDSGWEWDWLYYMGTVLLGMSEAVFWSSTPRKLFSLWAIHKRVNGWEETESPEKTRAQAWIDQYI
ncbi:hypothetical protein [Paenibacillus ihumii]|uniref:hypothetical protein n=1 Tax=Paenibacillus ihumii TaxID=687436 RepID=UPI0011DCF941|nr:hypothetical protein [Paenibacillus ihumii]